MAAEQQFAFETEFINGVFGSGVYSLTVSRTGAAAMRRLGVKIYDVTHVLMHGHVVRSDMLEMRGLWDVRGETVDGVELELTVAIVSVDFDVELLEILLVKEMR
jgi:hypothetical protein